MKKFVKSFTINEKKWGRATERTSVRGLLRDADTGKQCCLGIYLTACGYKNEALNDQPSNPVGEMDSWSFWEKRWPKSDNTFFGIVSGLAETNDAAMKLSARRKAIIEGFKKLGVKVRFK